MQISRRSLIAGATAATLLAPAGRARAVVPASHHELMRRLMGLTWIGQSRTPAEQFSGGYLSVGIGFTFTLNSDWSYEGAMVEKFTLRGQNYEGWSKIWGEAWVIGTDVGVSIYKSQPVKGTPLPEPMSWGTSKGDFRFYNDSSRKGRFTMQGVMTNDQSRVQSSVILVDAD